MLRQLIYLLLAVITISACGHEHPEADQATIALEDIKPTETTATALTVEPTTTTTDNDVNPPADVPKEMEEVVVLKDEKPVEKEEIKEKVAAKPVKKEKKKRKKRPKIKFDRTTYYFGLIEEGETITTKFWFDNIGDAPLLIKDASATCGCTYPGYPFVPIKPGERSSINVSFNSKGKFGKQKPVVTVQTNASSKPIKLYLEGEVKTEVAEN